VNDWFVSIHEEGAGTNVSIVDGRDAKGGVLITLTIRASDEVPAAPMIELSLTTQPPTRARFVPAADGTVLGEGLEDWRSRSDVRKIVDRILADFAVGSSSGLLPTSLTASQGVDLLPRGTFECLQGLVGGRGEVSDLRWWIAWSRCSGKVHLNEALGE
jgi:hypothetical protein